VVTIRTATATAGRVLSERLTHDPRLHVRAQPEDAYYASQTQDASQLGTLAAALCVVLCIAAAFGGMTTMYGAIAERTREIGCLRTLGFSRASILTSFTLEAALIGLLGGVTGAALAGGFAGLSLSMPFGAQSVSVTLAIGVPQIAAGIAIGVGVGAAGGLLPARRAAYLSIVEALRSE
jgi:ABC-type antimicrobial peptide transport system permease subunit